MWTQTVQGSTPFVNNAMDAWLDKPGAALHLWKQLTPVEALQFLSVVCFSFNACFFGQDRRKPFIEPNRVGILSTFSIVCCLEKDPHVCTSYCFMRQSCTQIGYICPFVIENVLQEFMVGVFKFADFTCSGFKYTNNMYACVSYCMILHCTI